jgi:AGZA family xanthine/uracil permease-like MFS transporter
MLDKFFQLKAHGTSVRQEIVAGLTTFAAMAYILAVNPQILSVSGMDKGSILTATALASCLMTILMALLTNYPIALAPGMGLNAFFAFTVCGALKVPWQAALGMVFWAGTLFLLMSATGLRRMIIDSIPYELKIAITAGIGLFIAFIGFKNGGMIVSNPATLVSLGNLADPSVLLVLGGVILTAALVWWNIRGAVVLGVLAITLLGLVIPASDGHGMISHWPDALFSKPASLSPTFLQFDLGYLWHNFGAAFPIVLSMLFVEVFDNLGTLIGVGQRAGLLDKNGHLPRIERAFAADACAGMIGSCLGTSTVTSYIESAAGVEAGGRTGLTAITTAGCFLLALFLTPIILMIPPQATAPALIIVGVFMLQQIVEIDLKDFSVAVPAFMTMVIMPLAFSITEGVAIGFITYVGFMLLTGRAKKVTWLAYVLSALFLAHYLFK